MGGIARWTLRFLAAAPAHGIDVRHVDIRTGAESVDERSRFQFGRLGLAARHLPHLLRVLRRERPQVAHVTSSLFWATPRDALAVALARAHGVPSVLQLRASSQIIRWRLSLSPLRRRLLDRALRLPEVLLVLSRELEEHLREVLPGQRIERIGNLVSEAERAPGADGPPVLPPRRAPCRVLFVGYRMPLKGLGELAEAVLGLPECELAVVGGAGGGALDPGADRRMEAALARLREAGRLVETGPVSPAQATCVYREADLFALPTHREGFPNTLLEAMAAGLPCVACPVGAVPEMLEGDAGRLVPVGDAAALREALAALAASPELRLGLGARARRRVEERYTEERVMERYRELYLRLAGVGRGAG
jgi:glycosyltransferase involved in cell wall biosynthesis